tara:strand:+ start:1610 stop:3568 length:1959 start_codon:yes stop_codon:yes gene_type:complete
VKRALSLLAFAVAFQIQGAKAPAPGIRISAMDRAALNQGLENLRVAMAKIQKPRHKQFLPDIQIFYNAVRYALDDDMFYKPEDARTARHLLSLGLKRTKQLLAGAHPWTSATGLIVRGYRSQIDDSVIPYGLEVPASYNPRLHKQWRLDVWLHGRNNMLSEVRFLEERLRRPSAFQPRDTIVLHPYGRYCNAYKFAGEVDVMEALRHVRMQYTIDKHRTALRGFSMGGAGAWHLGAHYAGEWAAVAPGAGFVDTKIYQDIFNKTPKPTWWEQKLWNLYDVPPVSGNFINTTAIAYSGELDKQRQAADLMASALKKEGIPLRHIIGLKTGHKYEPKAKIELARLVDAAVDRGANFHARKVRMITHTLRYNRVKWVSVHGLQQHWKEARVDAEYLGEYRFRVTARNVTKLMLGKLEVPNQGTTKYTVTLDNQKLAVTPERHAPLMFWKQDGRWEATISFAQNNLAKTPGLQGPIDDAFLSRFIFVKPTGKSMNVAVGKWVQQEMDEAMTQWHRQFRGNVIVKKDTELTPRDLSSNLILWGDPASNSMIAKIAPSLPITWSSENVSIRDKKWPANRFVPVLVYPNPHNLRRYIVINSGFTFSEFGHMSNSMQNAKLPDYAVLDIRVPITQRIPNGVAHAGFFGENWELTESEGKN